MQILLCIITTTQKYLILCIQHLCFVRRKSDAWQIREYYLGVQIVLVLDTVIERRVEELVEFLIQL